MRRNLQARERIESLARPAPSVGIERADSYNLQGWISEGRSASDAVPAYQRALDCSSRSGTTTPRAASLNSTNASAICS
jgi:hypothetical protein